jgi:hypothetical protein
VSDVYSVETAAALLPDVRRHAADFVVARADLAEITAALRDDEPSPHGGVPEMKALEARMHEHLSWFTANGLAIKGWAPLTLDFPAVVDGQSVLLCWLENETEIAWWHDPELGFAGRRRLTA